METASASRHAALDEGLAAARALVARKAVPRTLTDAGSRAAKNLERGPHGRPLCRWCQLEILAPRRRTFCSDFCVHQWRLRSDPGYLREQVYLRDRGVCVSCGTDTIAALHQLKRSRGASRERLLAMWGLRSVTQRRSLWDADHILPVIEGGGQCDLDNLRTLCLPCHREVTAALRLRLRRRASARTGYTDGKSAVGGGA